MAFVCTVMVVVIHSPLFPISSPSGQWANLFVSNGICRIAVPFFFLASGFFLAGHFGEPGWWRRETGKRIKSLLLPVFVWGTLFALQDTLLQWARNLLLSEPPSSGISFPPARILRMYALNLSDAELGLLWFMRTLFVMVVLSPLLKRLANGAGLALLGLFMLAAWPYPFCDGVLPLSVGGGIFAMGPLSAGGLFYFTCGLFLRRKGLPPGSVGPAAWAIPLAAGLALLALRASAVCLDWPHFLQCYAGSAAIPFAMLGVWRIVPSAGWPGWLTRGSIGIYLMHMFVVRMAVRLPAVRNFPGSGALVAAFAVAIPLALCAVLRSCVPRTARILFGGR
jgi:surface polysaccharide O-acyltransferase-like enzyme